MTNTDPVDPTEPLPTDPTGQDPTGQDPAAAEEAAKPWYKRPITWMIAAVLAALLVLGLVLAFSGDDDDRSFSLVTIDRVDDAGNALEVEMVGTVRATVGPESYRWLTPADADAPEAALSRANSSGTVTFRWGPNDDVNLPDEWASSLTLTELLPPNTNIGADSFDCTLRRDGGPDSLVVLTVAVAPAADPEEPSTATYTFENFEFLPNDIMTCGVANGVPGTTTTTTSTTVPETTVPVTTVPETTVPETTVPVTTAPAPAPTTAPPAPTTAPPAPTTAPATTTPPEPATSVMTVIEGRADLSTLVTLIDVAGLRETLSDPNGTLTVLAPNDAAFADFLASPDAPDVSDPAVVSALLLAHTNITAIVSSEQALADGQVAVANGGPQPVDPGPPATVGGAVTLEADLASDNGVVHVIAAVLSIQP